MSVWDWSTTAGNNTGSPTTPGIAMAEGMAPSAVNDGVRRMMADIKEWWKQVGVVYTSSGTNTVTLTLTPTLGAYTDGQVFTFLAGGTNTGAVTLNIDTLGAKTVYAADGSSALAAGDITSGYIITVAYRSSLNGFQLLRSTSSAPGNFSIAGSLTVGTTGVFGGVVSFPDGSVSAPSITNTGDTNTGIYFPAADTVGIAAGGVDAARFNTAASGVNYLDFYGAAANGVVSIRAAGNDTNLGLDIRSKGTDPVQLYVGSLEALRVTASTSAVNYAYSLASATGASVEFGAAGGDTNINLNLVTKGSGVLQLNGSALTDASENFVIARFNSGTSASSSTFWRGDGAWAAPTTHFTSSDQTITAGTSGDLTLPHSLGAVPRQVQLSLVAQASPELGYSEGDEVVIDNGTTAGNNGGWGVVVDATNIKLYPSSALSHVLPNRSSSNTITAITLNKWKLRVRAWL